MLITSRANPQIQFAKKLRSAAFRTETGLHFIEGESLVLDAINSGAEVKTVFALDEAMPRGAEAIHAEPVVTKTSTVSHGGTETISVSPIVMETLCESKSAPRLCAVVKTPPTVCPDTYPDGLIIVLETVQDPGNVGTIIRTADALGAAGVILSPACADPFAGKTLRAAMGSTYHIPLWRGDPVAEIVKLKSGGFICLCGHLQGDESLPPLGQKTALVIGNEGHGVSAELAALCQKYRMPMRGKAESLNAAVFAGIMTDRIMHSMGR